MLEGFGMKVNFNYYRPVYKPICFRKDYSSYDVMDDIFKDMHERERCVSEYNKWYKETIDNFVQEHFPKGVNNYSTQEILEAFGIEAHKNDNNLYEISHWDKIIFKQHTPPHYGELNFRDIGIDENKLLKEIEEIKGDANFNASKVTDFGELKRIGGNADFSFVQAETTGKIAYIGGDATFYCSNIRNLENLKTIEGNADFRLTNDVNIENLETIGKNAIAYGVHMDKSRLRDITKGKVKAW